MKIKTLMRTKFVEFSKENKIKLDYYLVTEWKENQKYYGIMITKTDFNDVMESEETGALTESEIEAMDVLNILIRNDVTPMGLVESVDELMSVRIGG